MEIRLDKMLAASGLYSRSEARALIRAGRVRVDGAPARAPEEKHPGSAEISVDGERLDCSPFRALMLHKPAGVLSATEDARQETVLDLLPARYRRLGLFPVGRLDRDTTGLLILTNDGDLAHRVISPRTHVPKVYRAAVDGTLDGADVSAFAEGLVLADGTRCRAARLELLGPSLARVTVFEGKYHQVKRMLAARGKPVTALHRERVGGLALDPALPPGAFRALLPGERELLLRDPICENDGRDP